MNNLFKRFFCKHTYIFQKIIYQCRKELDFSGDGYNTWTEVYDVYKCKKCGKLIRKLIKII